MSTLLYLKIVHITISEKGAEFWLAPSGLTGECDWDFRRAICFTCDNDSASALRIGTLYRLDACKIIPGARDIN